VQDSGSDTEDCIIVSVPKAINKGLHDQSRREDKDNSAALHAPLNISLPSPKTEVEHSEVPPSEAHSTVSTLDGAATQSASSSTICEPVSLTEVEHSEVHLDPKAHPVVSTLDDAATQSTSNSAAFSLAHHHGLYDSLPEKDKICQQPEPRPEKNGTSESDVFLSPPQQTTDWHVENYFQKPGHPSISPSASPKNMKIASTKTLKGDETQFLPKHVSIRSPDPLDINSPINESNTIPETLSSKNTSNFARQCPSLLPSSQNFGNSGETTPYISYEACSETRQNLSQISYQDQNNTVATDTATYANLSLVSDITVQNHPKLNGLEPVPSIRQIDHAPLSPRSTSIKQVVSQCIPAGVACDGDSLFGTTTPTTPANCTKVCGIQQTRHKSSPIVENRTPHIPSNGSGQTPANSTHPLHISQLLSPESPKSSISSSVVNAQTSTVPRDSLQASCPNPVNLSSSGTPSYPMGKPYHPPPVRFTDSEHVDSNLPPAQLKSLTSTFDRIARISIQAPKCPGTPGLLTFFPIRSIMLCELELFYEWYSHTSLSHGQRLLRFELVDVTCQSEKEFIISENQPDSFRLLKQYIWDMFWVESHIRGPLEFFTVAIEPYLPILSTISCAGDSGPAIPSSSSTSNQSLPGTQTDDTRSLPQLPYSKSSNPMTQCSTPLRTSAEKMTLRMVSIRAIDDPSSLYLTDFNLVC
jgi:hypothetical protein